LEVTIQAGSGPYRVLIGSDLLDTVGDRIADALPGRTRGIIITDSTVGALFAERCQRSLAKTKLEAALAIVPAGETAKNLAQIGEIIAKMTAAGLDRRSFLVGLGGGVVGDLSGFVAAIFYRGIPHIQIPTTLLAMVDSSIGGKTGVNTDAGKNLIGAVHQPSLVIDDVELLRSLPQREFRQGFAEIVKGAVIADAEMFVLLNKRQPEETGDLQDLIKRNVEIKAGLVSEDEQDRTGQRAVLNFGHTVGHAIERAGDYRQFFHGEAISIGMVAASRISARRAGLAQADVDAIKDLLERYSLPTSLPDGFDRDKIMNAITADKKFEKGQVRFVVSPAIGSAYLSSDVTLGDIEEALAQLSP
jgi:3-dehydroquinate synthase